MAEIVHFTDIQKRLLPNLKEKDKSHQEKYAVSLALADERVVDILGQYGVVISKGSQFKVLTIDVKKITQALELSDKMGFLDAYKENPNRLCQLVTNVIKRMAKCDALGIVYKDAEGHFANFLFSERAFNAKLVEMNLEHAYEVTEEAKEEVDNSVLYEYGDRLVEQFAIDVKDDLREKIDKVSESGLGYKETLLEVFKSYVSDNKALGEAIDKLLELKLETNEEVKEYKRVG